MASAGGVIILTIGVPMTQQGFVYTAISCGMPLQKQQVSGPACTATLYRM